MSDVSISKCLSKGFHPPAGSRLPILIPLLIFLLAISPFFISLYMRAYSYNEFVEHLFAISMAHQKYSTLTHFTSTLITNLIIQPLLVGTLLCAIRSQQDDENLKPTFFTAFKTYAHTIKLLPIIVFTTILNTTFYTLVNSLPGLHSYAQHHYYIFYVGVLFWSILGFILIFMQIFIVDTHCSTLMALKKTCKKILKFNIFISFAVSFTLYYVYVFFTLFLIPIGMQFISIQQHSINYFIVGVMAIGFSFCWLLHAIPGLFHIPAYIYLEQTSHADTSTKENEVNSDNTQKETQETIKKEEDVTSSIDNQSTQTT